MAPHLALADQLLMGDMGRLCHEHAAVDVEGVSGDVGGFFGGEKGDGVGDVGVGAYAAEGDVLGHGGLSARR